MPDIDKGTLLLAIMIFLSAVIVFEGCSYVALAIRRHSFVLQYGINKAHEKIFADGDNIV